ncbi:MAG: undecaprenyl/decaprenyl-phosphate alpha-N-acetylglucosaminyl 1-phosphate transferase [Candidatus Nanopelagicales bacterium]|nr:undecaprenyl/decaprenyl-phosphate alpha-N-acetylglucosaminyl 1-phosphate transferase [Candidatus Nanopelagicales bacterium]MCH9678435.1 undecaprenyl/decaprenyl-phosphate alpha-N-acetylglucosaminyl 1-phosphate transferase [Actinomycetes bacterium]OUV53087.1 MAG: undecaprenyl-phosphate alpha-N-acetylglucosaminyl 1-phosphate transferase [Actinomycetales bacterium TMED115]MBL6833986.1 undecaprenyl/decaprenyl-phosphate alpha-N-acetylglucosaminyl 1-phosphate transferase [Candidatus Nanopelagicales 
MREYILCLVAAAAVTYLLTPVAREFAKKWKVMAPVRDRDVHDTPTPLLGGLAMVGGLLAGGILASKLPMMSAVFDSGRTPLALLSGVAIIVALGVVDDKWGLDAPTKLAGQVLAAGVMAFQGIAIIWLPIGGTFVLDPLTSVLFTVLIVVISINAINFVDGLDGLAAGIVLVAAGAFFGYAYLLSVESGLDRATLATLVSVLLVGMTVGFLPHNYTPARIFMGDTGSMLLGLLLAAGTITLSGQVDPSALTTGALLPTLLPIALPVAVMAIPLVDLLLAVIRRTRAGRNPFAPDKQHLHHRLLEMGHSQGRAVLLMYAWTGLVAGTAVAVAFVPWPYAAGGFIVGLAALLWLVRRPSKSMGAQGSYEQTEADVRPLRAADGRDSSLG